MRQQAALGEGREPRVLREAEELVGVIENVVGVYLGTELKLTVALVIIVTVLVLKPSGLFGRVHVARV